MSLILDALRKMELERRAKRLNSAELRTEVLNYRGAAPAPLKARILPVITLVIIAATATAGLLYFWAGAAPPGKTRQQAPPATAGISAPPAPPVEQLPPPPLPPTQPAPATRVPVMARPTATTERQAQPPAGSSFTISGIAWQEERSLRRAVINGSLVGEGAEIAGAKVVEIRENLVRFVQEGKTFEVSYP